MHEAVELFLLCKLTVQFFKIEKYKIFSSLIDELDLGSREKLRPEMHWL